MKNLSLFIVLLPLLFLSWQKVTSQYYYYNSRFYESNIIWEIGASAMAMNCLTDVGGRSKKGRRFIRDLHWQQTKPGVSFNGKLLYNESTALRIEAGFGKIAASDSVLNNKLHAPGRYKRNLQVESAIVEGLILGEWYPLSLVAQDRREGGRISPYVMAGVGFFHFNPVARFGGMRLSLQPLHTEGQGFPEYPDRKPYALNQWNIPVGVGFRYELSAIFICGVELLYRKLFTDYLDDVSKTYVDRLLFYQHLLPAQAVWAIQLADRVSKEYPPHKPGDKRGNPGNKDAYLSVNIRAALTIGREKR